LKQEISNMAIPRAVKRKAEKARELARQMQAGNQQAPQGHQMMENQQPAPNQSQQVVDQTPIEATPVQQAAPSQETAFAPQSGPADDWELRYKNLRSARNDKLEAERLRSSQLEAQLIELAAQAPRASQGESQFALSKEELEGMSEEEAKLYGKVTAKMEDKFKVEQQDDSVARESIFFADVASVVPQWEALNADPHFMQWLSQADGFSGKTLKDTLIAARSALDANTVTALFSAYLQEGNANQDSARNELAQHAPANTVDSGRSHVPANNGQGVLIITNAEIKGFYAQKNEVIRRKKMTPDLAAQYDAQEQEIRLAMKEGRIR
jgi:hypothetical protein